MFISHTSSEGHRLDRCLNMCFMFQSKQVVLLYWVESENLSHTPHPNLVLRDRSAVTPIKLLILSLMQFLRVIQLSPSYTMNWRELIVHVR